MRVLGLDIGKRRIGIALSDTLGISAQGLTVLERHTPQTDVHAVCALAIQHGVERIVVGLPLTMKGERGEQAQRVMAFVDLLRRQTAVPVELLDERFTTAQGEKALLETGASRRKRKAVVDRVAAQLILQQFLDLKRSAQPPSAHS